MADIINFRPPVRVDAAIVSRCTQEGYVLPSKSQRLDAAMERRLIALGSGQALFGVADAATGVRSVVEEATGRLQALCVEGDYRLLLGCCAVTLIASCPGPTLQPTAAPCSHRPDRYYVFFRNRSTVDLMLPIIRNVQEFACERYEPAAGGFCPLPRDLWCVFDVLTLRTPCGNHGESLAA